MLHQTAKAMFLMSEKVIQTVKCVDVIGFKKKEAVLSFYYNNLIYIKQTLCLLQSLGSCSDMRAVRPNLNGPNMIHLQLAGSHCTKDVNEVIRADDEVHLDPFCSYILTHRPDLTIQWDSARPGTFELQVGLNFGC